MRRWTALLALVGTLFLTSNSFAQEQPAIVCLLSDNGWAQFGVVAGHIKVMKARFGQKRKAVRGEPLTGSGESLTFSVDAEGAKLLYELVDAKQHLTLEVVERRRFDIQRRSNHGSDVVYLHFQQDANGGVVLTIGEQEKEQQQYEAICLWRLLLQEQEVCQQHLLPILEMLNPAWHLTQQVEEVENELFKIARSDVPLQRAKCEKLVQQLSDDDAQIRRSAMRRLRELGQVAFAYLTRLDLRNLEAEQRTRITTILQSYDPNSSDTPQRVALWLADDKEVWLKLLAYGNLQQRRIAAGHLSRICDVKVEFNPMAADDQRIIQLERLRTQLVDQ